MNNNSNIHRQQQQQPMSSPTGTPPTTPPQRAVQTSDQHQQQQQQQYEPLDPPQILATPISRHYNHHKPQQEEEKDDDLLEKATAAQQPKEDVLQHDSPPHSPSVNIRVDSHQSTSYLQTTPQQHNALPVIHFPPPPQSRQQQQQQQITLSPFPRSTSNISQQTTVYYNRQPVPTKTKPEQQIQHAIQDLYTDDYSEDNEDEKEDELQQQQQTHRTTTHSKPHVIATPACGDGTTTNVTPQKEECDDDIEPVVIIRPFEGNMLRRLMLPLLLVFVSYFLIFASCDSVSVLSSSLFASSGLLSSALTYVVVIILALMGPILTFFVHPLLAATVLSVFAYTAFIACNFSVDSIIVGGLLSGLGGICGFSLNMFVLMYSQYVADQDFLTYLRSPQCLKDQLAGCGPQDVGVVDDEKKLKTIDEVEVYITRITDSNDRVVRHALLEENPEHFARWKLTVDHRIATTNSFLTMVTNMGSLVGSVVSFCILHFLKSGDEVLTASSPIIRTLFIILLCCAFAGNVIFLVAYLLTPKAATATINTNSNAAAAAAKANENNTTTHAEPEQQKQQNVSILSSLKLTVVTGFYLLKTKPLLLSLFSIFVAYTPLGFVSGTFVSRGGVSGKLGLEYVIMFNAIISFCAVGISMFFGKVFVVGTLPRARALLALGVGFNIATLLVILMQPSSDWANLGHSWGVCATIAVLAALSSTTTGTALSSFIAFQCASPNLRAPGFCLVNIVKSLGLCITFLLAVFTDFYIQLYVLLGAFVVSLAFQFINVYTSWVIDVDDIQRQLEIWTAKQERHQPARPYPGQQQPQQTARRNSHIQRTSLYGDFYEEYREAQPGQHANRRSTHMNRPDVEMVQTHRRSTAFTQHHQQPEHHHKARVSYVFEEPRKSNNYFHATGGATTIGRQYGVAGDDITGVNHDAQQYYYEQRMSNQHMNLDDDDEQDPLRQSYAITYRQSINRLHHQQY